MLISIPIYISIHIRFSCSPIYVFWCNWCRIDLSHMHLCPLPVKVCFLYFCIFSYNFSIIYHLWILYLFRKPRMRRTRADQQPKGLFLKRFVDMKECSTYFSFSYSSCSGWLWSVLTVVKGWSRVEILDREWRIGPKFVERKVFTMQLFGK